MNEKVGVLYIFGDGDRVRERIEGFLFSNDLEGLSSFSRSLSEAIRFLATHFSKLGAEVIMAGGDDLLIRITADEYRGAEIARLSTLYREQTGASISFGIGPTIESAYLNLRRAKSSATQKIVETRVPL